MLRRFGSAYLRELIRPLIQMSAFVLGSGAILSTVMVILALLLRGSAADEALLARNGTDLLTFTLSNLPQVLIDSVTLGFVYAAIALGYSMVYGVLEFINFAHSEIFATGAFIGVEFLIILEGAGRLTGSGTCWRTPGWWWLSSWVWWEPPCWRQVSNGSPTGPCEVRPMRNVRLETPFMKIGWLKHGNPGKNFQTQKIDGRARD